MLPNIQRNHFGRRQIAPCTIKTLLHSWITASATINRNDNCVRKVSSRSTVHKSWPTRCIAQNIHPAYDWQIAGEIGSSGHRGVAAIEPDGRSGSASSIADILSVNRTDKISSADAINEVVVELPQIGTSETRQESSPYRSWSNRRGWCARGGFCARRCFSARRGFSGRASSSFLSAIEAIFVDFVADLPCSTFLFRIKISCKKVTVVNKCGQIIVNMQENLLSLAVEREHRSAMITKETQKKMQFLKKKQIEKLNNS